MEHLKKRERLEAHSNSEHKSLTTERILRKTTIFELIERVQEPYTFDRRSSLHKLSAITRYLRQFYHDGALIPHEDVVHAIEKRCGLDDRTRRKYIRLLISHDYLKPASTKPSQIVYSKKFVQVKTKHNTTTREYSIPEGYKFYVFGAKAPKSYQQKLILHEHVNPHNPPTRSDEGLELQKNMCVSHSGFREDKEHGDYGDKASVDAIDREKKEEEVVLHTHICAPTQKQPQLSPLEEAVLRAASEKESDSNS